LGGRSEADRNVAWTSRAIAFALLAIVSSASPASEETPAVPLNIVLIDIDDLGYNDIGPYGEEFADTPALDRLAAESMRFTDGYAAAPVCSPTRAAILSGRYGPRTGITDVIVPGYEVPTAQNTRTRLLPPAAAMNLAPDPPTLAELLRRAGYRTAHIGKWHLGQFGAGGTDPAMLGFDEAYDWNSLAYGRWYATSFVGGFLELLPEGVQRYFGWSEYTVPALTERAVAFIERNVGAPFFLQLSHYTVHDPLQARPETVRKYEARLAGRGAKATPKENPYFAAMLEEMDASVGAILEAIDHFGLREETVVIFTSDNGGLVTRPQTRMIALLWETAWPHTPSTDLTPLRAGKGTLYEGGIRVPYIVRWPGVTAPGSVSRAIIHSIDLLPTIAAMAGVPPDGLPVDIDGMSLVPILRGKSAESSRGAIYWHYPFYPTDYPGFTPAAAIRTGRFKGVYFYEDDRFEVYDLERDLGETQDVSAVEPAIANRLRASLRAWQKSVGATHPRRNVAYMERR
jgi:arylsulfatase A-like enzyme